MGRSGNYFNSRPSIFRRGNTAPQPVDYNVPEPMLNQEEFEIFLDKNAISSNINAVNAACNKLKQNGPSELLKKIVKKTYIKIQIDENARRLHKDVFNAYATIFNSLKEVLDKDTKNAIYDEADREINNAAHRTDTSASTTETSVATTDTSQPVPVSGGKKKSKTKLNKSKSKRNKSKSKSKTKRNKTKTK
jgi:hypothetical protein